MNRELFISVIFSFSAALSFAVLQNIQRRKALVAAFGGALSWMVFELGVQLDIGSSISLFLGSMVLGVYSEIMARRMKSPATIFYIPGFVPLVPGSNVYYSVLSAVQGDPEEALRQFLTTMTYSAAIALGLIIASALVAIYINSRKITWRTLFKEIRKP